MQTQPVAELWLTFCPQGAPVPLLEADGNKTSRHRRGLFPCVRSHKYFRNTLFCSPGTKSGGTSNFPRIPHTAHTLLCDFMLHSGKQLSAFLVNSSSQRSSGVPGLRSSFCAWLHLIPTAWLQTIVTITFRAGHLTVASLPSDLTMTPQVLA